MAKRESLGRGLGALIPKIERTETERKSVSEIPIDQIQRNPDQPRKRFNEEKLELLTQSIAQHGILQPLVLVRDGNQYRILAGERRWRAAGRAGLKSVPAVIRTETDPALHLELALIENLQREDLNPIEEADGFKSLMDEFGYTQESVSKRVGRSRSAIANSLRLLGLDKKIKEMIVEGKISAGHGRALASLENAGEARLCAEEFAKKGLSVREAEKRVSRMKKEAATQPAPQPEENQAEVHYRHLEETLMRQTGWRIRIRPSDDSRGKVEIYYASLDEFDHIVDRLKSRPLESN